MTIAKDDVLRRLEEFRTGGTYLPAELLDILRDWRRSEIAGGEARGTDASDQPLSAGARGATILNASSTPCPTPPDEQGPYRVNGDGRVEGPTFDPSDCIYGEATLADALNAAYRAGRESMKGGGR